MNPPSLTPFVALNLTVEAVLSSASVNSVTL